MKTIYLIVNETIQEFGWPVNPKAITEYHYSLKDAQEAHKNACIAAGDCKAFAIRGPYEDDTEIEAFHMLQSGMKILSLATFEKELNTLGYKIKKNMCLNYFNSGNERHYKAVSLYYVDIETGLSFAHINGRRDERFKKLQKIRKHCFVYHNSRIYEL